MPALTLDFLDAVYTTNFPASTTCAELQKQAWEYGARTTGGRHHIQLLPSFTWSVATSYRSRGYVIMIYKVFTAFALIIAACCLLDLPYKKARMAYPGHCGAPGRHCGAPIVIPANHISTIL